MSLYKRADKATVEKDNPNEDILWFGFGIRLGPKEDMRIYGPFLKYLEMTTGKRFSIKFTERYEDMVENLGNGITHFAVIDSLSYVSGRVKYGYGIKYLISGINKDGHVKCRSVIFTRPESNLQDMKDLKGRSFVFGARMSTQGHLIPRKMLEDTGITLNDLSRYIHTDSQINTVRSVLNGEYDAGCIHDALAKQLSADGRIKVLKISGHYPCSLIAYNSAIDDDTVQAVRLALLSFDPIGRHKDMLVDWDKTEMPLGFTINEYEFYNIAILARRYGLLTE